MHTDENEEQSFGPQQEGLLEDTALRRGLCY